MLPPDAYEAVLKMVFVLMAGCVLCMAKINAATFDYNQVKTYQIQTVNK